MQQAVAASTLCGNGQTLAFVDSDTQRRLPGSRNTNELQPSRASERSCIKPQGFVLLEASCCDAVHFQVSDFVGYGGMLEGRKNTRIKEVPEVLR
jgi:hypothetical protein